MTEKTHTDQRRPNPWIAVSLALLLTLATLLIIYSHSSAAPSPPALETRGNQAIQPGGRAGVPATPARNAAFAMAAAEDRVPLIPQNVVDLVAVRGDEPYDIAISPDGSRAYVPARNTDNLFVIDLASNQIVEVIDLYPQAQHPLGPAPDHVALTPDGARLLVTNANDKSLTVIDTATNRATKTLRFDGDPQAVAISPDGSVAYVSISAPGAIVEVIDVVAAEVLTRTPGVPGTSSPVAVAFAPDGSRAYLAMMSGELLILDPSTHTVSDTIAMPNDEGIGADLIVSADGRTGYVSALDDDKVLVLDLVNRQVSHTLAVTNPEGLALNADESRLYVGTFGYAGESAYNVWMFDTQSGQVVTGVNFIHPAPYGRVGSDIQGLALTPDGNTLYASSIDADGVFVVDPVTLEPRGMIPTQAIASFFPLRAAVSPDGARLYVGGGIKRPATVSVIDTATLAVVDEMADGGQGCASGSDGLALSPDGGTLYLLSTNCNEVLVFDTQSGALVERLELGAIGTPLAHVAVHPDGGTVYVLDSGGSVYVVDTTSLDVTGTLTPDLEGAWTLKLAPNGARGYVTGGYGYAVLDLASNSVVTQVNYCDEYVSFCHVHGRALGVTPDGSQYLVGEFFTMHVYDAATDAESHTIDLSDWNPGRTLVRDVTFSPDGSTGYAAMWDEKAVLAFDTDTWEVAAKIDTGRAPYFGVCPVWLALSPDGGTPSSLQRRHSDGALYAVAEESDNVVVIDTATNAVRATVRVGRPYPVYLPLAMRNAVPPTTIAGTVTDAGGSPLAGMTVRAGNYDDVANCGGDQFSADTAGDGSYRLDVTPGTYLVFVNSHNSAGSHVPEAYADVNRWSAIQTATPVTVVQGQTAAGVDFSLPDGFTVSGRLVDSQGQPVLGAGGHIHDDAQGVDFGCALGFGSSDADGTFRVNVPAGTYDLGFGLGFGLGSENHTVVRRLAVSDHVDLGDVLFAEAL